jgi:hypothetical protein
LITLTQKRAPKDTAASVVGGSETPQGLFTGEIAWDIGNDAFEDPARTEEAVAGKA